MSDVSEVLSKLDERLAGVEELLAKPIRGKPFEKKWYTVPEAAELQASNETIAHPATSVKELTHKFQSAYARR